MCIRDSCSIGTHIDPHMTHNAQKREQDKGFTQQSETLTESGRFAPVSYTHLAEAEELFQAAEDNAKWRYNNYKRLANQAWGAAE